MSKLHDNLPEKPGVYLFKDATGQILYVGKAKNLKKRVSSYFTKTHGDRPWIEIMMPLVADLETIVVNNELESLMLEATMIKQHLPHFNIKLTDDKSYPYIKLVTNEAIPRFVITRRRLSDKARYFGPYLSGRAAQYTLEFLRKLYGIHINSQPLTTNHDRPCLNCQLDGFTCPLNGEVDEETYSKRVISATDFLEGKRKNLVRDLEDRMTEAGEHQQFELAAKLRDRLQAIKQVTERQQVISTTLDDYDVIGSATANTMACVAVLKIREGRLNGQKNFFFEVGVGEHQIDVVRQFLITMYSTFADIPGLIAIDEPIDDQEEIERYLCSIVGRALELRSAERGEKRQLVDLAIKNAQSKLETRLLKTDQAFVGLVALKEVLGLEQLPERIEAVDISNLGTSEPVGATVCFINGVPDKNEYRRYKIKTVEGQNDFAMIREIAKRRFSDTSRPGPDLFVVDGGPEQLKFALQGITEGFVEPKTVISLAKKPDRIFLPNKKRPLAISRSNKGLLLLSRIRDEVHRFGIGFQRTRQRKKSLRTD